MNRNLPAELDREAFDNVKEVPETKFPNVRAWYYLIQAFTPAVRMKWAKKEEPKPKGGKGKKPKEEKAETKPVAETKPAAEKKPEPEPEPVKKPEEKKAEAAEDDFFGGGEEELEAAKKLMEKKKVEDEEAKKKKEKAKPAAKSYVQFEVKIIDNTTNLDQLAKRIFSEIKMDGLVWEKDYKKAPFAFGIDKLLVACVIEDDKVSTDDIADPITEFDEGELVQSVDILVFNKL